jgi:hypothetical protein
VKAKSLDDLFALLARVIADVRAGRTTPEEGEAIGVCAGAVIELMLTRLKAEAASHGPPRRGGRPGVGAAAVRGVGVSRKRRNS